MSEERGHPETTDMRAIVPGVPGREPSPIHDGLKAAPTRVELAAGVGRYDESAARADALDFAAGSQAEELRNELSGWWRGITQADLEATVPKAVEYGSSDLKAMGAQLVALHPGVDGMDAGTRERVGTEMAIAFYLLGKVTRLFGAYERGGEPSYDTILDVTVYSMMFRRVRETGGWPK